MGLWKYLDPQKVAMMRMHPSSEKTEQTRSIMAKLSSCRCESSLASISILPVVLGPEAQVVVACWYGLLYQGEQSRQVSSQHSYARLEVTVDGETCVSVAEELRRSRCRSRVWAESRKIYTSLRPEERHQVMVPRSM
jgi:hypothetical protein